MLSKMKYGQWQEDEMNRALATVRSGDMGVNETAITYSVPRLTLKRHLGARIVLLELRLLAFDIAERNEMLHRFSKEKRMAGKKWYYAFKTRHPLLNFRQPESTSFARAKGFDKES
ncbi:hypothetical protein ANN_09716, partial [Periplaneta americana]